MKWLKKILPANESEIKPVKDNARQEKVETAARDFAVRFEQVMKELANS